MNLQLRTHYWTFNCLERLTCAGARGKEQRKERSWEDQERENDPCVWMKESGNRIHFSNLRWVGCCPAVGLNPLIMFLLVLLVELIIHELMDWIFRIGAIFSSEMFCNIFKSRNNKDEFNLEWHRVWTDPTLEKNMQKCLLYGRKWGSHRCSFTLLLSHAHMLTAAVIPTISKKRHDRTLDTLDKPCVLTQYYFPLFSMAFCVFHSCFISTYWWVQN